MNKPLFSRFFRIMIPCLLILILALPATASAGNLGDRITIGSSFAKGDYLTSQNGRFTAIWQNDGNFVVYQNGSALWSSRTNNSGAISFKFEPTGKLVMYKYLSRPTTVYQYGYHYGFNPATGKYEYYYGWGYDTVWITDTTKLQDAWFTDTASWISKNGRGLPTNTTGDTLIMQNDGNLVLYNSTLTTINYPNSWIPVWASNTTGR
ncbi:hypothetical protein [Paenibacillus sp. KS-LC4]|uniref:hypothetical protein n=1 Tax=Paenibacillus sp. KS-LC4 TaxID=2979727 RepID=UPI0030D2EB37